MSNTLMNFLLLPKAAWRLPSSSYYATLRQVSCTKGALLSSHIGDLTKLPDPTEGQDTFTSIIKTANSTTNILKIVHDHHRQMDDKHSVQALKALFALQKEGKSDLSTQRLLGHPDFEKICKTIKRHSGVVELNDTIDALKVLVYVGVPAKSTIVQVLLQIIRGNINSLSVPQLLFVDFMLRGMESTPLGEALRIALPLVFDINLKLKMNTTNASQMTECLHYAQRNNLSEETISSILEHLEHYQGEFQGETALNVLTGICNLPRNVSHEALVNRAATDLIVNIDNISIQKMELVINKLAHRYTNYYRFYYQEVLFDTCANYIIDKKIDYKRALGALRNMARLHHVHKPLIDYVCKYIHENPRTPKDPADIYSLVISLILTDYEPPHWNSVKKWIKEAKNLAAENRREIIWIRFAAALCLLDIYKIDVLTRALNEHYISHLLEKGFRSDMELYLLIWQCLTTYKPDLTDLLPTNFDPQEVMKRAFQPTVFPLEGALQTALGGEQFVLTDLHSKLGVQIDHALIFSDGSAVAFETHNVKYVEDIKLEDNSQQLVIIWTGSNYFYTINTNEMRAATKKTLNILGEINKCNVIAINLDSWYELQDFEKIPYLMQKLKEKLHLDINVLEHAV